MEGKTFFILSIVTLSAYAETVVNKNGGMTYKYELCLKAFATSLTPDEGTKFCKQLNDGVGGLSNIRNELESKLAKVTDELSTASLERNKLQEELQIARNSLEEISEKVIPVGSIYIEYYNQQSPQILWPDLVWKDITSQYAGLFFRASGGSSETWGVTQAECAPRITEMRHSERTENQYVSPLRIPASGWSEDGDAGRNYCCASGATRFYEGLRFYTQSCEIRPRNQAIRVWKREG